MSVVATTDLQRREKEMRKMNERERGRKGETESTQLYIVTIRYKF